jgi:phage gp36-like protein
MAVETILKQPAEARRHPLRLAALSLPSAIENTTVDSRGLVPGSAMMTALAAVEAGAVLVDLAGGTDGERYLVTVRVSNAAGEIAEAELDVTVIEGAWVMPDGGTGYLTITDFVDRVGLPEVIAATDGIGDGRIDRAMLLNVLSDAQALVDTYFASRYQVPLVDPPLIVKKLVADLARVALYPRGAPDGVAEQGKASTRLLERIQSGALQLSLATPPTPAVSENPILILPGRRAYPDGLRDY